MKERSIIFNSEMIRAILEGRKTQTRRVIKPQPQWNPQSNNWTWSDKKSGASIGIPSHFKESFCIPKYCRHGKPGDSLWVRETFARVDDYSPEDIAYKADQDRVRVGITSFEPKWTPLRIGTRRCLTWLKTASRALHWFREPRW